MIELLYVTSIILALIGSVGGVLLCAVFGPFRGLRGYDRFLFGMIALATAFMFSYAGIALYLLPKLLHFSPCLEVIDGAKHLI